MARPQILPNTETLLQWADEGLSHRQMAERVYEQTGHTVTRGAISVALHRAGETEHRDRYLDTIPWTLHGRDLKSYPARMLRLLGRRRRGLPLNDEEARRLDRWLARCEDQDCVVAYDPDRNPSLFYVYRRPTDDPDIPIRRERVFTNPNAPSVSVQFISPN